MIQALKQNIKILEIELVKKRDLVMYISQASELALKELNESFDKLEKARMDLEKELKNLEKMRQQENEEIK